MIKSKINTKALNLIFLGRDQPIMVACFALAKVKALSLASLVMTDPAPIVAPIPTVTGATKLELLPMNARSPIVVVNLLMPS